MRRCVLRLAVGVWSVQRAKWLHEELIALTAERLQNVDTEGADFWANVVCEHPCHPFELEQNSNESACRAGEFWPGAVGSSMQARCAV